MKNLCAALATYLSRLMPTNLFGNKNPLAAVRLRSCNENYDIYCLVQKLFNPPLEPRFMDYWSKSGLELLSLVILHLLYQYQKEGRSRPDLVDVSRFLSQPNYSLEELLETMKAYPHITPEEVKSNNNIFQEIYGDYIADFTPFCTALKYQVHNLTELKKAMLGKSVNFADPRQPFHILLTNPMVLITATHMLTKDPNDLASILATAKSVLPSCGFSEAS